MVEVTPDDIQVNSNIGQVVLKRLISAEEALDILTQSEIVSQKRLTSAIARNVCKETLLFLRSKGK